MPARGPAPSDPGEWPGRHAPGDALLRAAPGEPPTTRAVEVGQADEQVVAGGSGDSWLADRHALFGIEVMSGVVVGDFREEGRRSSHPVPERSARTPVLVRRSPPRTGKVP
ncbi:hypothetical protein KNE206_61730 [Kitasatospora sp. NE20-6]